MPQTVLEISGTLGALWAARPGRAIDILLVEDNEGDIVLLREVLGDAGLPVRLHVARDGLEAMDFLQTDAGAVGAHRPDVIVLDLDLPRLHGREVLERLAADESLRAIPVVVLSSSSAESDVRACYRKGADLYVTKPAELDAYVHVVGRLCELWLGVAALPAVDSPAKRRFHPHAIPPQVDRRISTRRSRASPLADPRSRASPTATAPSRR